MKKVDDDAPVICEAGESRKINRGSGSGATTVLPDLSCRFEAKLEKVPEGNVSPGRMLTDYTVAGSEDTRLSVSSARNPDVALQLWA
jgi:hypothetical protein